MARAQAAQNLTPLTVCHTLAARGLQVKAKAATTLGSKTQTLASINTQYKLQNTSQRSSWQNSRG